MNYVKEALTIKSVKRTLNIFAVLSLLVIAAPLANLTTYAVSGNSGCFDHNSANASVKIQGNKAVAHFKVPQKCDNQKHRVSLVVYKINDGNWENKINNQYIYDSKTVDAGTGWHTISANLPSCAYQVDLIKGNPVNIANGGNQGHHLAAKVGGNAVPCKVTPTPPHPTPHPKPTPTPPTTVITNTNTNTNTINNEVPAATTSEEAISGKGPDTLVNTGPGDVAAAFAGVSAVGTLGYRYFLRKRVGLDI